MLYRLARASGRAADWIQSAARRLHDWWKARQATAAAWRDLSQMSDSELSDIGLRRADIEAVARGHSPRYE
jgi:uncharacterized protein YjiS (DUF1127 family)